MESQLRQAKRGSKVSAAVIYRKLSCGNNTEAGKTTWETLLSLDTTAIKQGRDLLTEIAQPLTLKTAPDRL